MISRVKDRKIKPGRQQSYECMFVFQIFLMYMFQIFLINVMFVYLTFVLHALVGSVEGLQNANEGMLLQTTAVQNK